MFCMYYWLDPCSKGKRLANRGCMQLFHLNIFLIKYNLFLICSSGELKRGSLNRMYCFTRQVLTRARSADCINVLQTGKTQSEQCFILISKLPQGFKFGDEDSI